MRTNPIPFDRFITEVLRLYDPLASYAKEATDADQA